MKIFRWMMGFYLNKKNKKMNSKVIIALVAICFVALSEGCSAAVPILIKAGIEGDENLSLDDATYDAILAKLFNQLVKRVGVANAKKLVSDLHKKYPVQG